MIIESDVDEFLACSTSRSLEASRLGIRLYGGELLAGEQGDWLLPLRVLCASEYVGMLERIAEASFRERDYADALHYGLLVVDVDRGHERATRLVMRTFAALGRREMASGQYQALKRYLSSHLAVRPTEETSRLLHAILKNEPFDVPESAETG